MHLLQEFLLIDLLLLIKDFLRDLKVLGLLIQDHEVILVLLLLVELKLKSVLFCKLAHFFMRLFLCFLLLHLGLFFIVIRVIGANLVT